MPISVIKFFHVLGGVTFLGIIIASFFYITRSIQQKDSLLIQYSLKTSYFGDAIIFLCTLTQFSSATPLILAGRLTKTVPWIWVAYHAFALLIMCWISTILVKKIYLSKPKIHAMALKFFYGLNIFMILLFITIIHDAVTQSTILDFLFRN